MAGYIQVYTGNGKGKTTAAIGLTIRAIGAGKKVLFIQFMKSLAYSEQKVLMKLEGVTLEVLGKPFFVMKKEMITEEIVSRMRDEVVVFEEGHPPADYVALIQKGVIRALEAVSKNEYDVIILDEYNVAEFFGLITEADTRRLIEAKNPEIELIFTGRNAGAYLLEKADLITEMKEIKHYYTQGVEARLGIEH